MFRNSRHGSLPRRCRDISFMFTWIETVGLDTVGLELADLCQAIASAHRAIVEIMNEDALGQLWLEIADEGGRILAIIP